MNTEPPSTSWYETNLIWIPVGSIFAILLTLVVAFKHEFRWLLFLAWLVSAPPIWLLAKRTREVWLITGFGLVLSGAALIWFNHWLDAAVRVRRNDFETGGNRTET